MTKYKYYSEEITKLNKGEIFVFGSNLAGRHGKGAALTAKKFFGAEQGIGYGHTGDCYAIPTKNAALKTMQLHEIDFYIERFKDYSDLVGFTFLVSKVGCGLAGYKDEQIAPLFRGCNPENVVFHEDWMVYLE